jgi:hypothetical protein
VSLAQRELLGAARALLETLLRAAEMDIVKARRRLSLAIARVELEDALPSVDVPAFLRRQAE